MGWPTNERSHGMQVEASVVSIGRPSVADSFTQAGTAACSMLDRPVGPSSFHPGAPSRGIEVRQHRNARDRVLAEFDPHEAQVLLEACRTMDAIEALLVAVDRDGVMVTGSQGEPALNGAMAEIRRQQQAALARLLIQMDLDAVDVAGAVVEVCGIEGCGAEALARSERPTCLGVGSLNVSPLAMRPLSSLTATPSIGRPMRGYRRGSARTT